MSRQVILIMTDTTRKDMLGCYGNEKMITPNLDRLAAEGIRYDNAYTCQPVCGPARSAIFTGMFPHTNGVVTNCVAMGDNIKTIGQRLTDQGCHCGYIGKWHLDGSDYFGNGRCPEGWDQEYWYDMRTYLEELSPEDRVRSRNSQTAYEEDMTEEFTYAHRCSDRALRFLDTYRDSDFFLTVSYDEPHGPCLCPGPYNTMYEGFCFEDNPGFADENLICADASSTSELVYEILDEEKISKETAEALYLGIVHDTGVFQYSNTTEKTMGIAGKLMAKGIDFTRIVDDTFYKKTYVQNQILGRALMESILLLEGRVIMGRIRQKDMEFYGVGPKDLEGIVNQLRVTQGVEVAIFLHETGTQEYKVSLRSNGIVDVSRVCAYFGGGGHVKAAGCTMHGTMYDVVNNLTLHIEQQLLGEDTEQESGK